MTSAKSRTPEAHRQTEHGQRSSRPRRGSSRLTIAEWVSFGISALIIVGLAVFLIVHAFRSDDPFLSCEANLMLDQVRRESAGR